MHAEEVFCMKKRNNRFLAGTLAGLMMLTMLPVTALAAQEGADDDAVSDTSNNIVNVVSDSENGQQAENNNVNAAATMPIQLQLISRRAK